MREVKVVLIEPVGIETTNRCTGARLATLVLIEPVGIETK